MNERIYKCELEYYKCFSHTEENENIIRFCDDKLRDMYYHNFTYVSKVSTKENLHEILKKEISYNHLVGRDFCNIMIDTEYKNFDWLSFENKPRISVNGYYSFDISNIDLLKGNNNAQIEKVTDKTKLDDALYCDLQHDEKTSGRDFCQRRCYRRGEVYLSESGVDSYICYFNGKPVGNCDLFIYDKVAKIEDFAVIPQCQRRGIGTAILKHLIKVAIDKNCDMLYLVTDEADTAKEMYQKLSFTKIGERTDLFYKF